MAAVPAYKGKPASAIQAAILKAFRDSRLYVKGLAEANLHRVLKSRTGQLASSVYARVSKTRSGGNLRVGTKVYYGRFWEYGFNYAQRRSSGRFVRTRRAKRAPGTVRIAGKQKRPWLRPAAEQAQSMIASRLEHEVNKAVADQFQTVNIDLKIMG